MVVGVPPEVDFWSPEAHAGGQHPFLPDYHPNHAYFDVIEPKIAALVEQGIVPCLVGGWGPHIQQVGPTAMSNFWQMIIERFAKYDPVWCLCGEVDLVTAPPMSLQQALTLLPKPLASLIKKVGHSLSSPTAGKRLKNQLAQWQLIGAQIRHADPHHLLLAHPHAQLASDELLGNPAWLDVNTIQSGHSVDCASFLVSAPLAHAREQHHDQSGGSTHHNRPFINIEPWYEGIHGRFDARAQRYAFYTSLLAGARGHTYGADGLWNMRTADDHFLSHWGTQTWQQASTMQGATQLGRGKIWFEQWPWWQLQADLEVVFPHWTDTDVHQPICAQLPDHSYLCYVPDATKSFAWRGSQFRAVTWYDPRALTVVHRTRAPRQATAADTLVLPPSRDICDSPDLLAHFELLQK